MKSRFIDSARKFTSANLYQLISVPDDELNAILQSHVVEPEYMYRDDFYGFFGDRKERILRKIEAAMGKTIARDQQNQEEGSFKEFANSD